MNVMRTPIRIGFTSAEPQHSDVYKIPLQFMRKAAQDALSHGIRVDLLHSALPKRNPETQINHIRDFVKRGATALLVHPCDVAPLTSIINECVDAGIPVIVLNLLQFRDGGDLRATAYIGFDNHVAGALAAYACVDYLGGPGCIGKSKWGSAGASTPIDVEWYSSRTKASEAGNIRGRVVIIEGVPVASLPASELRDSRVSSRGIKESVCTQSILECGTNRYPPRSPGRCWTNARPSHST